MHSQTVKTLAHPTASAKSRPCVEEPSKSGFELRSSARHTYSSVPIQRQVDRILHSPVFIHSVRLSRFLKFVVAHVLDGKVPHLKEYVIGAEVYDRRPPYHPSQDSIVRTEACRLRGKLKEYYSAHGANDPWLIQMIPGSYAPTFECKQSSSEFPRGPRTSDGTSEAPPPTVIVLPFRDISRTTLSSLFARGIPDELAYALVRSNRLKVIPPSLMHHLELRKSELIAEMLKCGATFAYEGSVREEEHHIRITGGVINQFGVQVWAQRLDASVDARELFAIEEQFASSLSRGMDLLLDKNAASANISSLQQRHASESKRNDPHGLCI